MKIGYLNNIIQRIPVKRACQGYYVRWWYNGWHYWFFLPGRLSLATEGEKYRTLGTRRIAMGTGQITREQCDAIRTITNTREIYLYTTIGWMNLRIEQGSINIYDNRISGDEFDFIAIVGSREDYFSPVVTLPDSPSNPTKYIYGFEGIYITHHTDVFTMILTGDGDITIYWGDGTVETYTLTDVPLVITHTYVDGIPEHTIGIDGEENIITLDASGNEITEIIIPPSCTSLTELILDDNELTDVYIPPTVPLEVLTLTNNPLTVCEVVVGTQIWMCYNYDSDFPGSKVYNNDEANRAIYGGLYSYDQVVTAGFVPAMWHVPTKAEWESLITFVGGAAAAGGVLKEIGTTHWDAPNTGAVDTYDFAARGSGLHLNFYGFVQLNQSAYFRTADEFNSANAWVVIFQYNSAGVVVTYDQKTIFSCVRLLKNFIYKAPYQTFDDWFLPSKDELMEMHDELYIHGVGEFGVGVYASSSEFSATHFIGISMSVPVIADFDKNAWYLIRPCRSFVAGVGAYSLRDVGPAGGLIFYIDGVGTTYYEAYPSDINPHIAWSNIMALAIGTTSTAIGEGQNNTNEIIAQVGHTNSYAKVCNDLEIIH